MMLMTCETANEMWNKLSLIHEEKSETNKLTLLQRFYKCSMESNDNIIQFIIRVQNIARQLKDVGEMISDAAVIANVLDSLPAKYGSFVSTWDSVESSKQTITLLQERLIKEEKRLSTEDERVNAFASTNKVEIISLNTAERNLKI